MLALALVASRWLLPWRRQGGQGLVSPACGHLKSAWTADFLGRSVKLVRAARAGRA
jgi:hypothetical protein